MSNRFYKVYGVVLESDLTLSLPEAAPCDVAYSQLSRAGVLAIDRIGATLPSEDGWIQVCVLNDGAIYMRWTGWLEFLVSPDGRHIAYNPLCDGPPHSFEAYLANFAVSAAMIQRGEEPLHATVVEWGGRGIGMLGPSGAGKSSLAAHLLTRGGRLVTDDMLRITFDGGKAYAQPGPLRLKLNADTVPIYGSAMSCRGEWSPDAEKFLFEPATIMQPHAGAILSALFWLDEPELGQDGGVTLERLCGLELFKHVSASTMNSLVSRAGRLQRQLAFAKAVGDSLPVFRLAYPRRHDRLDEVADAIRRAVA